MIQHNDNTALDRPIISMSPVANCGIGGLVQGMCRVLFKISSMKDNLIVFAGTDRVVFSNTSCYLLFQVKCSIHDKILLFH